VIDADSLVETVFSGLTALTINGIEDAGEGDCGSRLHPWRRGAMPDVREPHAARACVL
jgi:hypothetical protein